MKKNLWKIMAALLVAVLPLVVASCGDDDDEKGPKTYTYNWALQNTTFGNSAKPEEQLAAAQAAMKVDDLFAAEFAAQGFEVDAANDKFTITTDDEISAYDKKVELAVLTVQTNDGYAAAVAPLPSSAKIVIKRGGKSIIDKKLR